MPEQAEELIIRNLLEALGQLQADLHRIELWTAVLYSFQHPAPPYQPNGDHVLPPHPSGSEL